MSLPNDLFFKSEVQADDTPSTMDEEVNDDTQMPRVASKNSFETLDSPLPSVTQPTFVSYTDDMIDPTLVHHRGEVRNVSVLPWHAIVLNCNTGDRNSPPGATTLFRKICRDIGRRKLTESELRTQVYDEIIKQLNGVYDQLIAGLKTAEIDPEVIPPPPTNHGDIFFVMERTPTTNQNKKKQPPNVDESTSQQKKRRKKDPPKDVFDNTVYEDGSKIFERIVKAPYLGERLIEYVNGKRKSSPKKNKGTPSRQVHSEASSSTDTVLVSPISTTSSEESPICTPTSLFDLVAVRRDQFAEFCRSHSIADVRCDRRTKNYDALLTWVEARKIEIDNERMVKDISDVINRYWRMDFAKPWGKQPEHECHDPGSSFQNTSSLPHHCIKQGIQCIPLLSQSTRPAESPVCLTSPTASGLPFCFKTVVKERRTQFQELYKNDCLRSAQMSRTVKNFDALLTCLETIVLSVEIDDDYSMIQDLINLMTFYWESYFAGLRMQQSGNDFRDDNPGSSGHNGDDPFGSDPDSSSRDGTGSHDRSGSTDRGCSGSHDKNHGPSGQDRKGSRGDAPDSRLHESCCQSINPSSYSRDENGAHDGNSSLSTPDGLFPHEEDDDSSSGCFEGGSDSCASISNRCHHYAHGILELKPANHEETISSSDGLLFVRKNSDMRKMNPRVHCKISAVYYERISNEIERDELVKKFVKINESSKISASQTKDHIVQNDECTQSSYLGDSSNIGEISSNVDAKYSCSIASYERISNKKDRDDLVGNFLKNDKESANNPNQTGDNNLRNDELTRDNSLSMVKHCHTTSAFERVLKQHAEIVHLPQLGRNKYGRWMREDEDRDSKAPHPRKRDITPRTTAAYLCRATRKPRLADLHLVTPEALPLRGELDWFVHIPPSSIVGVSADIVGLCAIISGQINENRVVSSREEFQGLLNERKSSFLLYSEGKVELNPTVVAYMAPQLLPTVVVARAGATLILAWRGSHELDDFQINTYAPWKQKHPHLEVPRELYDMVDVYFQHFGGELMSLILGNGCVTNSSIPEVAADPIQEIVLTGHSLGGGIAQIAQMYLTLLETNKESPLYELAKVLQTVTVRTLVFSAPMTTVLSDVVSESASIIARSKTIDFLNDTLAPVMQNIVYSTDVMPRMCANLQFIDAFLRAFANDHTNNGVAPSFVETFIHFRRSIFNSRRELMKLAEQYFHVAKIIHYENTQSVPVVHVDCGFANQSPMRRNAVTEKSFYDLEYTAPEVLVATTALAIHMKVVSAFGFKVF